MPAPYGTVDIGEMFAESLTAAYPDSTAPADGWAGSSDEGEQPAGHPDPTTPRDATGATDDAPETEDDAARETAPTTLTLTEAELQARIEEATRRARADQAATAARRSELERENARLARALQARDLGLDQLQRTYQGTQAETEILRERQNMDAHVRLSEQQEAAQAQQQAQYLAQLEGAKQTAATAHYAAAMKVLGNEGGKLGMEIAEVEALVAELFRTDETLKDFNGEFIASTDLRTAEKAAQRAYRELEKAGKAALQAKKIAELTPARDESPPPIKRTRAYGSAPAGSADPLARLPASQRGVARLQEAMAEDFARLGIS